VSRLRRLEDRDRIFFVTTNITRAQAPLAPAERDALLETLAEQRASGALLLFAYVVMPDHVHVLLAPHGCGLIAVMRDFKQLATHRLAQAGRRAGPLWQPRYFDHILRHARDFSEKLDYIHRNPVEAGFAATPTDWRWSSAAAYVRILAASVDGARDNITPPVAVDTVELPLDGQAWLRP
jgi:putative transposase